MSGVINPLIVILLRTTHEPPSMVVVDLTARSYSTLTT